MNKKDYNAKGFTLVELAIVLVIIGLIVAGVVAGQNLIKQAELRNVLTNIDKYQVATNSFITKFNGLPGDLDNAHDYFGTACDSTPANCNGDGDGTLEASCSDGSDCEAFRFFQHLNLADMSEFLVTGTGGGISGAGTLASVPGVNTPAGPRNEGFYPIYFNFWSALPTSENVWVIGRYNDVHANRLNDRPAFTPTESRSLDLKIDDGMPNTGVFMGRESGNYSGSTGNCKNDSNDDTEYLVTNSSAACYLGFVF